MKLERKATFSMPTVLYSCRFLAPPIVIILVIYNISDMHVMNGIIYTLIGTDVRLVLKLVLRQFLWLYIV